MTELLLQRIVNQDGMIHSVIFHNALPVLDFFQIEVQLTVKWEQFNSNSHSFFSPVCGKYKHDCKHIERLFLYVCIKICCCHITTCRHMQAQICLKQTTDGWVWPFKDIKLDWKENCCRDLLTSLRYAIYCSMLLYVCIDVLVLMCWAWACYFIINCVFTVMRVIMNGSHRQESSNSLRVKKNTQPPILLLFISLSNGIMTPCFSFLLSN